MALVISSLHPSPCLNVTLSHNNMHVHRRRRFGKVRALSNKGGREKLPEPEHGDIPSILSIDGGRVRGIIPTRILDALESKLQKKDNCPEARIADYFDMVAGTSTGGLIATLLTAPDQQNGDRPLKSATELTDFYLKEGPQIFPGNKNQLLKRSTLLKAQGTAGSTDIIDILKEIFKKGFNEVMKFCLGEGPAFPGDHLHRLVEDTLKELTLNDTLTNVLLTPYDMHMQQPTIFCTLRGVKDVYCNLSCSNIFASSSFLG